MSENDLLFNKVLALFIEFTESIGFVEYKSGYHWISFIKKTDGFNFFIELRLDKVFLFKRSFNNVWIKETIEILFYEDNESIFALFDSIEYMLANFDHINSVSENSGYLIFNQIRGGKEKYSFNLIQSPTNNLKSGNISKNNGFVYIKNTE